MEKLTKQEILLLMNDVDSVIRNSPEDSIYDVVEVHTNATVEILRNTKTGEVSVGWYENTPLILN